MDTSCVVAIDHRDGHGGRTGASAHGKELTITSYRARCRIRCGADVGAAISPVEADYAQPGSPTDYAKVWEAGEPPNRPAAPSPSAPHAGQYLVNGLGAAVYIYPGRWVMNNKKLQEQFQRVERSGKPRGNKDVCASFPEIQQYAYNAGASVARTFGHFPALQAALVHSEIRDGTDLCFHAHDQEAYRRETGLEIPAEVQAKVACASQASQLPRAQIVPDDHPILQFYRWFWKDGDGWTPAHPGASGPEIHRQEEDLWTFFDPAVRVPSLWGAAGRWITSRNGPTPTRTRSRSGGPRTSSSPWPMASRAAGDEDDQVIWYMMAPRPSCPRMSRSAPRRRRSRKHASSPSRPTICAGVLVKISRPIRGICMPWLGLLVETGEMQGYCYEP